MYKWIFMFVAVVVLSGCIGIDEPIGKNQNIAFEVVVNNSNLAPNSPGHPAGSGERVSGTLYYTNTSAIQLFVFAHADTAAQTAKINLSINNTIVSEIELRPLTSPEDTHSQITAIIPKSSNYSVNISNYHHYEWREYPILSGRNGTLSIVQNVTGSSVDNGTIQINESQVNNLIADLNAKVNKSGDNITGILFQNVQSNISQNITVQNTTYYASAKDGNGVYNYWDNSTGTPTLRVQISTKGIQYWHIYDTGTKNESGDILYTSLNNFPEIIIRDNQSSERKDILGTDDGLLLRSASGSSVNPNGTTILNDNNGIKIDFLNGTGNAYVCVDSTGKLYRGSPGC